MGKLALCVALAPLIACDGSSFEPPDEATIIYASVSSETGERPQQMAVGDDHVFWTTEAGDLHRVDKDGDGHTVIASDDRYTRDLSFDGERVVWAFGTAVVALDVDGAKTELAEGNVTQIATGMDRIFWLESTEDNESAVRAVPVDGGDVVTWYTSDVGYFIAVGEDALFVMELLDGSHAQVVRITEPGASQDVVATDDGGVRGRLVVGGEHIYWANAEGVVSRVALDGDGGEEVASGFMGKVAADEDMFFGFDTAFDYTLARVDGNGDRVDIINELEREGVVLGTGDEALFWLDWKSECLAEQNDGKFQNCVEYLDEIRLWAIAK